MFVGPLNNSELLVWHAPTVTVLFSASQAELGGTFSDDGIDMGSSGIPG